MAREECGGGWGGAGGRRGEHGSTAHQRTVTGASDSSPTVRLSWPGDERSDTGQKNRLGRAAITMRVQHDVDNLLFVGKYAAALVIQFQLPGQSPQNGH